jgi:hypothetical protein
MAVEIYGIRHHGPGSARSLLEALARQRPDCILLEHPADVSDVLSQALITGLEPPVAMLVYDPKAFSRALYYPFAVFSPEWQALRYAAGLGVPVRPMDLPAGMMFMLPEEPSGQLTVGGGAPEMDPLGYLSSLAGYADGERWWEVVLEQRSAGGEAFVWIAELMTALREAFGVQEKRETLLREAYMRRCIREAVKAGYERIAVVCGAWHVPALQSWAQVKASADASVLRGLKKVTVQASWIPWTYERLATESGYGAGVLSPVWYELLFVHKANRTARWMAAVAKLLRWEGMEASPAHVLEAVRLAESLAALRGQAVPGIETMDEAVGAVFFQGSRVVQQLIRKRLIIGDRMGRVPRAMSATPLQRDFEQAVKTARLSKEYDSARELTKELDLRVDTQRKASLLLHRVALLGMPWGRCLPVAKGSISTFRERWLLSWLPEYTFVLIRCGMYGNTVLTATERRVQEQVAEVVRLQDLVALAEQVLPAELPGVMPVIMARMASLASLMADVYVLLEVLPGLVRMVRYGDIRITDTDQISHLTGQMIPRLSLGLPGISTHLDDAPAETLYRLVVAANRSIRLLDEAELEAYWLQALHQLRSRSGVHPLLRGLAVRLLFDRESISFEEAFRALSLALSPGEPPVYGARWMEGFLSGSGLLLLYHPPLWQLIDRWVTGMTSAAFREVLPLLRRVFSEFGAVERQQMLALVSREGIVDEPEEDAFYDPDLLRIIGPTMRLLLGE